MQGPVRDSIGNSGATAARLSPTQELAQVMAEIIGALHGAAALLTSHPSDDRAAQVIYAGPSADAREMAPLLLVPGALRRQHVNRDLHRWITGDFPPFAPEAIALPVQQVPGHSRLVITVFFDQLDAERRARSEAAYLARKPFAVGYFRLWQEERLQRQKFETLRSAFDRVDLAVMLIDTSEAIVFANEAARRLLGAENGLFERNGRLAAHERRDNAALTAAIVHLLGIGNDAAGTTPLPMLTIGRKGQTPLMVSVMPPPYRLSEPGEIGAMVFAVDPDTDIMELAVPVCVAFGLTNVETELACALARGRTLQETSETLRIKSETAKGYLKSIFLKTGVNRQADLIRLILVSLLRVSNVPTATGGRAPASGYVGEGRS